MDIIDISKNRFSLMENLNNINAPFSINRNLVNEIEDFLNDTSISLLLNLDKFLLYFTDNEIEVTRKKKMIKKSFLPELCFLLNDNEIIYNMVKQYNLNHYIINDKYSVDINL